MLETVLILFALVALVLAVVAVLATSLEAAGANGPMEAPRVTPLPGPNGAGGARGRRPGDYPAGTVRAFVIRLPAEYSLHELPAPPEAAGPQPGAVPG
jgi:hypothetical protein